MHMRRQRSGEQEEESNDTLESHFHVCENVFVITDAMVHHVEEHFHVRMQYGIMYVYAKAVLQVLMLLQTSLTI
jgi:TRAP-type mannitol/chloroaromatic compound transport system permease small subunit